MQQQVVRLGFLGFGEAAYILGKALNANGLTDITAYSPTGAAAAPGDPVSRRASDCGVKLVSSPRELCKRAEIIISLTPGALALAALRSVRRHLKTSHIYVDATTSSVKTMERAAKLLGERASFVDAAIMGALPLAGLKSLIVVSGSHADAFRARLEPYGMNVKVVGEKPGAASAMKLIRSVCMKGIAAMLIESLEAAERVGLLHDAADDIARSIDEVPFAQTIKRFVCGSAVHAQRRVHEMTEAMELLKSLGSSTRMTRATRAKLRELSKMDLREEFGGREPAAIAPVLQAIVARNPATRA
ncbi:MAG: DUF1932 domain-containing protein [Pseudomonadota bacterium]